MDNLDRLYGRKKFFKIMFPELNEGEFYRVFQAKDDFSKVSFFDDVDEMNDYCDVNRFSANTYFSLSTTNGIGGSVEDIISRSVLGFDFDRKDYPDGLEAKDVMYKFKELGIWYHCLNDSGNGFHAYMCIETTSDIDKVVEVTKAIGEKLGADPDAMKTTQILRIPFTYNLKDEKKKKHVGIIKMFEKSTIKPYNLNSLYERFCNNGKHKSSISDNKATNHILNTSKSLKPCIREILERKVIEGSKNADLQKIVVTLRRMNKSISEIKYICKEWNNGDNSTMNYQIEHMYNNLEKCSYECKGCKYTGECFNVIESDFEYEEGEEFMSIEYKNAKKLKDSKRVKVMDGNELLIFNVLKNNINGLHTNEIIEKITFKKKCRLSLPVIRDTLNSLVDGGIILKASGVKRKGISDFYTVNPIRTKIEDKFTMSYLPTLICIYGIISPSELRLYTYIRYLHDIAVKDNKARGNIFRISQEDLAKDLGSTQPKISIRINNLIESKLLEIWEVKRNDRGFDYYTYKLNK